MRHIVPMEVERARMVIGPLRSSAMDGFNGKFMIPCKKATLSVVCGDGTHPYARRWEHVSVSLVNRCPTWEEMEFVRHLFWGADETVLQFHPPVSDHVNVHPYCLHLWRRIGEEIQLPPQELIA